MNEKKRIQDQKEEVQDLIFFNFLNPQSNNHQLPNQK